METMERALVGVHDALMIPKGIKHVDTIQCLEWHLNCCLTTSSKKKATHLLKMLDQASNSFCNAISKSKSHND